MSVNQHIVATTVVTDQSHASYHGAGWYRNGPIGKSISPDADGVYPQPPGFTIDLSHMLSRVLGRQLPMMATYRVTGIRIGCINDDDTDDNDRGAFFSGYIYYRNPTSHIIDALQAARSTEKWSEGDEIDGDALFMDTSDNYEGFRFGWDGDQQVNFQTNASQVSDWIAATGDDDWNMSDVMGLFAGGLDQPPNNANWNTRIGGTDKLRWACSINNAQHVGSTLPPDTLNEHPGIQDYVFQCAAGRHIEVVGGLLACEVRNSNTIPNGDVIPDDYEFQVEVTVEGWSSW